MAINQTITAIPEAGHRGVDVRDTFVIKQEAFQDALTAVTVTELNTYATEANTTAQAVNDDQVLVVAKEALMSPHYTAIDTVSAINTDVTDVALIDTAVSIVAGIDTEVATVAVIHLNVTTVAGISGNVTTVATNDTNVTTVATNDANITKVALIDTDVTTTAGISTDVTTTAGISGNVTTVAGISGNVTTVADNGANITTVANLDVKVTIVADDITNVNTVAIGIDDVNNYADTYYNSLDTAPTIGSHPTLSQGDLYFDTILNALRVYDGVVWKDAGSTVNGTTQRENFEATAGQTVFTITGGYDPTFIDVYLNGIRLLNGDDVTVTSGTDIVLTLGAELGDIIDIVAFGSFGVANASVRVQTITTETIYIDATTGLSYKMYVDNGQIVIEEI